MKNEKIINSWNKINPDKQTKDIMLKNITNQIENFHREEKENIIMIRKTIAIAACIALVGVSTVFAAYKYLSAEQLAYELGDNKLAEIFNNKEDNFIQQGETIGDYKAAIIDITSGKNISDFKSSSWDIHPERTYAVVAVEKTDGTEMTYDDEILVTPLIEGLEPWKYNIFTMNGGYCADIIDGVLYRIIEFDNIEYFADRNIYIAVLNNVFYDNDAYNYDEKTGLITRNNDYEGTNILFNLNIDKSKANPQKAEEYIKEIEDEFNSDNTDDDVDYEQDSEIESNIKFNIVESNGKIGVEKLK